jgi:hypothetical protein
MDKHPFSMYSFLLKVTKILISASSITSHQSMEKEMLTFLWKVWIASLWATHLLPPCQELQGSSTVQRVNYEGCKPVMPPGHDLLELMAASCAPEDQPTVGQKHHLIKDEGLGKQPHSSS